MLPSAAALAREPDETDPENPEPRPRDLRMAVTGLAAWAGGLVATNVVLAGATQNSRASTPRHSPSPNQCPIPMRPPTWYVCSFAKAWRSPQLGC